MVVTAVIIGQQTSKWETVVHIMCTILITYLFVMAVIVVLIKHNCKGQRQYFMSPLVSLKVAFCLSCIKKYEGRKN